MGIGSSLLNALTFLSPAANVGKSMADGKGPLDGFLGGNGMMGLLAGGLGGSLLQGNQPHRASAPPQGGGMMGGIPPGLLMHLMRQQQGGGNPFDVGTPWQNPDNPAGGTPLGTPPGRPSAGGAGWDSWGSQPLTLPELRPWVGWGRHPGQ